MGKSWMKPRRDSRQMISPEYHLIVSEGKKTEPQYFQKIKDVIDAKYRDRIHLDISGKEIRIEKTEEEYTVTLPLL